MRLKVCDVYTITCSTGEQYVGAAKNVGRRWWRHQDDLRCGVHGNRRLQAAYILYGEVAFTYGMLLICSEKDLLYYEQRAMNVLCPKYNVQLVVGRRKGQPQSEEPLRKNRARERTQRERTKVDPARMRLIALGNSNAAGHVVMEEVRRRISKKLRGNKNGLKQKNRGLQNSTEGLHTIYPEKANSTSG